MSELQTAGTGVRQAAANPLLEFLERFGYVARGVLYVVMGVLALRIATGAPGGRATDLTGALVFLIGNPFGKWMLIAMIIGLAAYAIWGLVRATFDPLHRGSDKTGLMERLGFVSSALSYGAISFFGLKLLMGSAGDPGDSTQTTAASLLAAPFGGTLTTILGLAALGVGLGQFMEAYRAVFARDLKSAEMTSTERSVVVWLGRFGMAARGVTFLVIGWFLILAGVNHNAAYAHGFGGAFLFLLAQPFGPILVGVVTLGFIALGAHSVACARWIRLMGSHS